MTSTGLRGKLIALAIGLLIVVALVVATVVDREDPVAPTTTPEVFACLALSGPSTAAEYDEVDCAAPEATYRVMAVDAACDRDAELTYRLDGAADSADVVLCLDLNAAVGDCFRLAAGADLADKVACTEAAGDPAVVQVRSIGGAGKVCPPETQPRANPTRDLQLCLGPRP